MIIPLWAKVAILAVLIGVAYLAGNVDGSGRVTREWNAARFKADAEAAAARARSLEAARRQEAQLNNLKTDLEEKHAAQLQGLRIANGRLMAALGGLYDKNGKPAGGNGVPAAPLAAGVSSERPAGAWLPGEVLEATAALLEEADIAAVYAGVCREWAVQP